MNLGLIVTCCFFVVAIHPQQQQIIPEGTWSATVVDALGAAIRGAHVFTHYMGGNANVVYVGDSDAEGKVSIPTSPGPNDLIVFAVGFKPFVTFVDAGPANKKLSLVMQVVPCNYPGVICDTFTVPTPHKKKH